MSFIHSFLGHPIMAILHLVGLYKAGDWVHDITLPDMKFYKEEGITALVRPPSEQDQ